MGHGDLSGIVYPKASSKKFHTQMHTQFLPNSIFVVYGEKRKGGESDVFTWQYIWYIVFASSAPKLRALKHSSGLRATVNSFLSVFATDRRSLFFSHALTLPACSKHII